MITIAAPKMRGLVPRLETPHPLGSALPALYQEDAFAQGMMSAFDEALAPIFSTLDNLAMYFDPWLAPDDFVEWLGTWLGLTLDEGWPVERRRALVAQAHELYRVRGTAAGLKAHVELFTGGSVEVIDTGGAVASVTAQSSFPGSPNFAVLVRVQIEDPDRVNIGRLNALVAAAKPAHVTHRIEVIRPADITDRVEVTAG